MVDYPPINERIQAGFLNFTQGATGLLYYRADGWTAGNAIGSWNNVDTTACGGGLGRPGDGIFLYPPAPIASTESAPGNSFEGYSRRYSGLRIRADAQESGAAQRGGHHSSSNCDELEQLESRPERARKRADTTGATAPSAGPMTNWFPAV